MIVGLTLQQHEDRELFRSFAEAEIAPHAGVHDAEEAISGEMIGALAREGLLASATPWRHKGEPLDMMTYGLLAEEIGRACQSIRNFVAVEDMVAHAIWRWGTAEQRERWLPAIASGESVAAFALTEPGIGSDAGSVETVAERHGDEFVLRGRKKWISFGQLADVYLVFAACDGAHTAFLVERDNPGLVVEPIRGMLGLRGSMLAGLSLEDCRVPASALVARPGAGLTFVASSSLDLGRYSTAWGSVGLARACLEESVSYADERHQYGVPIKDHQLVARMLADMLTDTTAARLLCVQAGLSRTRGDADATHHTLVAKYRSSTVATAAASDAVQIHGAQGVGPYSAVQRHYRDAKIMEIIEGTTQIQQTILGGFAGRVARGR